MSLSTLLLDPTTQSLLVAEKTARLMARPPLEPITVVSPRELNISISRDRSPTTVPPTTHSDLPTSTPSPKSSPSDPSPKCTPSLSRKRQPSRRQPSISYLPADSPRLWTPRTPQTASEFLDRSPLSLSRASKKGAHARTQSIPFRAPSEPVVLTLAERHTDLLQTIAQKESQCLELRSQLAIHESELLDLKRKWERIVHREFGRNIPLSSTSNSTPAATLSLANTSSAVVLNGLVEGVRALAAATAAPPHVASSKTHSRALSSSSAFAKRMTRQVPSNSISSTTTTTTTTTTSSAAGSPRLSQSSMSSVAEEKPDLEKVEALPEGDVVSRNEDAREASAPLSTKRALVAQRPQQRSPTSPRHPPSPSSKTVRRHSRDSRVPLADALKSLTGESSNLGKRASVGGVSSSTSVSISGMNPLGAMGLGRANLGEAAQGWVDSVGSKLAELQKGQTFSKSQKRASVLLSDVSQSIFSALTPGSTANLIPTSAPPSQSLIDEDDDAGSTALGRALLPDVVSVSGQGAPSTPGSKEEEDEDWNW